MKYRIFLDPGVEPDPQHRKIFLTSGQSHYLRHVLRLGAGDPFVAQSQGGTRWLMTLGDLSLGQPPGVDFAQVCQDLPPLPPLERFVSLWVALPKTGFEDIIRQATEIGVGEIVPLRSQRTLLNPSPQKIDRWQRIAQEAAEQCQRAQVPPIAPPVTFSDALAQRPPAMAGYLCTPHPPAQPLVAHLTPAGNPPPPLILITGPEGGWTEAEVEEAIAVGYLPVSLGSRILRAVTAPLVALTLAIVLAESGSQSQEQP